MTTQHTAATRAAITNANRSAATQRIVDRYAATQRIVDRYAADPAAKAARSIALAQAHTLSAWLTIIARDCSLANVPITHAVFVVASQSQRDVTHEVEFDAADDSAQCDCPAGVNRLPCGHAGAALVAGRALVRGDAQLRAARAQREQECAAWHAALDAMAAHEQARRAAAQAHEEAALLYRNSRPFSMWRSETSAE